MLNIFGWQQKIFSSIKLAEYLSVENFWKKLSWGLVGRLDCQSVRGLEERSTSLKKKKTYSFFVDSKVCLNDLRISNNLSSTNKIAGIVHQSTSYHQNFPAFFGRFN